MRYQFLASALVAQVALAAAMPEGARTVYETEGVTITSCGPEVTNCPARSTQPPAAATDNSVPPVAPSATGPASAVGTAPSVSSVDGETGQPSEPAAPATTAAPSAPAGGDDGPRTVYQTQEFTITSCGADVTNCPARSTQPATGTASVPAPSGTAPASGTGQTCEEQENMCRSGSDANMATCSAERAACDGYIPGQPSGTASVPGQASGTASVPAPSGTAPASGSGQTCQEKENMCRSGSDANMATCSAERAACDGYIPGQPGSNATASLSTPTPTPAAPTPTQWTGAGSTSFVSFGVMALGAAAAAFVL